MFTLWGLPWKPLASQSIPHLRSDHPEEQPQTGPYRGLWQKAGMCDLREPNSFKDKGVFFFKANLATLYFPKKWSYWRKVFLLLSDNFSKKRTFLAQKQNHLFPVCKRESTETSPTRKQVRTKQTNKKTQAFLLRQWGRWFKRNRNSEVKDKLPCLGWGKPLSSCCLIF